MHYSPSVRIFRCGDDLPKGRGRVVAYSPFDGLHSGHHRLLDEMSRLETECRFALLDEGGFGGPRLSSRRRCLGELALRSFAGVLIRTARWDLGAALKALMPTEIVRLATEPCPSTLPVLSSMRAVGAAVFEGAPITSERLRAAVVAGDLDAAERMTGRPYSVDGRVIHGHHRGAAIGVPTANLRVRNLQMPPDGVYAVTVRTAAFVGIGVANLGTVPTFGNAARSLETHIFDFEGDLYASRLSVGFVERLRGEQRFDGVESLVAQIRHDIEAARAVHERR